MFLNLVNKGNIIKTSLPLVLDSHTACPFKQMLFLFSDAVYPVIWSDMHTFEMTIGTYLHWGGTVVQWEALLPCNKEVLSLIAGPGSSASSHSL